jgi:hypothetical protein
LDVSKLIVEIDELLCSRIHHLTISNQDGKTVPSNQLSARILKLRTYPIIIINAYCICSFTYAKQGYPASGSQVVSVTWSHSSHATFCHVLKRSLRSHIRFRHTSPKRHTLFIFVTFFSPTGWGHTMNVLKVSKTVSTW